MHDAQLSFCLWKCLFYAHVNIIPGKSFLKNMYIITYTDTHALSQQPIPLINPDKVSYLRFPVNKKL